ncbi:S9 family peptidase [Halovivax gelatinilyticus]|uniref:S9 family peptidase n=1 Tax=Halovivax gelatinilyticus TaxID=2961597 RepID=UPI0020CA64C6|nr:S9 family peptidase [Halovivax gelatinilyticus]
MSEPLSLEDRYDLRRPSSLALSPGGHRVAFVVTESDPDEDEDRRSLFVAPRDGSRDPHRLTRVANAGSPAWGPNGNRLAFVATRDRDVELSVGRDEAEDDDETGDDGGEPDEGSPTGSSDEPKPQVWVFDLALGGDARQLTAFEEGVREFDWSPDGERLVVSARDPTDDQRTYIEGVREDDDPYEVTRTQHKQDGNGFVDDVETRLFVIDADGVGLGRDDATRLDEAVGRGAREPYVGLQPAWGPSDRIAFVAYAGDDPDETYAMDVHTIAPDGSDRRTLTDGEVTAMGLRWSPDGSLLSYAAGHPTNTYHPTEVHVANPAAGETWSVSASLDRTVSWTGTPEWIGDDALVATVGDEARTRLVRLDARTDEPERVFDAQGDGRTVTSFDATPETTAVVLSHPNEGIDVFALPTADLDTGAEPTRLSAVNEGLFDGAALPTCERVTFENGDGETVEGLVYLPESFEPDASDPCPLVCHVHGGPTAYDAPGFSFDYAYWTGRGYAVLNVNYRGSTSYGRAFSESIRGEWGPREADDILSGVDHVVERGWADPDRLFISGFSQGGINTLYVVTRDDRFAAAAPEHGIYDFYANFGTADMHQWYVNDMGVPWENPDAYREISSIQDVDHVDTPLLITAGENDWRCPPSQAEQLYVSARRAGVEAKLLIYQDEHHNISRPGRHIHRLEALTEWFEEYDPAAE